MTPKKKGLNEKRDTVGIFQFIKARNTIVICEWLELAKSTK